MRFVNNNCWNNAYTRLILNDIYVRSVMQYAAPVWATMGIGSPHILDEHSHLKPLMTLYRQSLKMLLNLSARTPTLLLIIVSTRVPFKMTL